MNDKQKELEGLIDTAWTEYNHIFAAEIQSDYDDAMDMGERREAEGYALGLETAYQVIYGVRYQTPIEKCDEDNYEFWLTD